MAFTTDENGKTTKTENKNRGHVAIAPDRFKVTDADKRLNNEAYKRWLKGTPGYIYRPGKSTNWKDIP